MNFWDRNFKDFSIHKKHIKTHHVVQKNPTLLNTTALIQYPTWEKLYSLFFKSHSKFLSYTEATYLFWATAMFAYKHKFFLLDSMANQKTKHSSKIELTSCNGLYWVILMSSFGIPSVHVSLNWWCSENYILWKKSSYFWKLLLNLKTLLKSKCYIAQLSLQLQEYKFNLNA